MYDKDLILALVKQRLNRLASDTTLDGYLAEIIAGAADELTAMGIYLDGSSGDNLLLVNQAVQRYQNRDQQGDDPAWLRAMRRQRWLNEKGRVDDDP